MASQWFSRCELHRTIHSNSPLCALTLPMRYSVRLCASRLRYSKIGRTHRDLLCQQPPVVPPGCNFAIVGEGHLHTWQCHRACNLTLSKAPTLTRSFFVEYRHVFPSAEVLENLLSQRRDQSLSSLYSFIIPFSLRIRVVCIFFLPWVGPSCCYHPLRVSHALILGIDSNPSTSAMVRPRWVQ